MYVKPQYKKPIAGNACLMVLLITAVMVNSSSMWAQGIQLYNIQRVPVKEKANRDITLLEEVEPITLPFWDDFSQTTFSPDTNLWMPDSDVVISSGAGKNAPNLNVAVFDGSQASGLPHSNSSTVDGETDVLVSRPIKLAEIISGNIENTVFLSFFVQKGGFGEQPDETDELVLEFKYLNDEGAEIWEEAWSSNDVDLDGNDLENEFIYQFIKVGGLEDIKFFTDEFQFRFRAFGRQAGPFDAWNVDYVFLGKNRAANAPNDIPDFTISNLPVSLLQGYTSMPASHFLADSTKNLIPPSLKVSNLSDGLRAGKYYSEIVVKARVGSEIQEDSVLLSLPGYGMDSSIVELDENQSPIIGSRSLGTFTIDSVEDKSFEQQVAPIFIFPPKADSLGFDSLGITLKFNYLNSDNNSDFYISDIHNPLDFESHDSVQVEYLLKDYYAYDDGTAEFGAGTNQQNIALAYHFDLRKSSPDSLVAFDIYFPYINESNSGKTIELFVWSTQERVIPGSNGEPDTMEVIPGDTLRSEIFTILDFGSINNFIRYTFNVSVVISGDFFIGWSQSSIGDFPVGLDENTNSSDRIYEYVNDQWRQASRLNNGSLMLRPVFGSFIDPFTGVKEYINTNDLVKLYPNPTKGRCYVSGQFDHMVVMDLKGATFVPKTKFDGEYTEIDMTPFPNNLYVLQFFHKNKVQTSKLVVNH